MLTKIYTINDIDCNDINQHSQLTQTILATYTSNAHKPKAPIHPITFLHSQKKKNSQHIIMDNISTPKIYQITIQKNSFMFS